MTGSKYFIFSNSWFFSWQLPASTHSHMQNLFVGNRDTMKDNLSETILSTLLYYWGVNEGQRGAVPCPKSHSTLVTEIGWWLTLPESQSKLPFVTAHGNFTEILYSWYQCPLYVNSSSSSKQAMNYTEVEGQSRTFPPIFWRIYSPFLPLLLLKFQKSI